MKCLSKSKRLNELHSRVSNYVRTNLKKISVQPKAGLFNYRCYYNAVEYARNNTDCAIAEVIYIDEGQPILHYINVDKDGNFLETSLGFLSEELEYYFVNTVDESEWLKIHNRFCRTLDVWLRMFSNSWDRIVLDIDRVL